MDIFISFLLFTYVLKENSGQEVTYLDVPVMLPVNEICVRTAIEMAFNDTKKEVIYNTSNPTPQIYKLRPHYYELGADMGKLIDKAYEIYEIDLPKWKSQHLSKRLTIGPPYSAQNIVFSEYTLSVPTIQVSYTEHQDPFDVDSELRFQTPPSITGLVRASRKFMEAMNWDQTVFVYDFSSPRYRRFVNYAEKHFIEVDNSNRSINVEYKAMIRSRFDDIRTNSLLKLPHLNARILFLMASVAGARQFFCKTFHLELHKSQFVWILLEKLPEGWATDSFNTYNEDTGKQEREVICTPDELIFAAKSYIYINRGGLRRDGKVTVNNTSAENFASNLQNSVGPEVQCKDTAAYAYDSVWAAVKVYQKVFKNITDFKSSFKYFRHELSSSVVSVIQTTDFEGVTGRINFGMESLVKKKVRVGLVSINIKHQGEEEARVGNYDAGTQTLHLIRDSTQLMFRGPIPSDIVHYFYKQYQFPKGYIFTIWTLACFGILVTIILSCTITVYRTKNQQILLKDSFWIDIIISLGCIVCFASLIMYGLDTRFLALENYKDSCYGFLCTLSIGFTLTFGVVFAKIWYKYKSFDAPNVEGGKREFSEWFMFLLILLFLFVDVILLISWSVASPFHYVGTNISNKTLAYGFEIEEIIKCDGLFQKQFSIGIYCYKGVLLVFGLFLALQTSSRERGISSLYSEKSDEKAIFNTVLVAVVGVICVSILEDTEHRHALYAIITLCVVVCTGTTLALTFIPRISNILYPFRSADNSNDQNDKIKPNFNTFKLEKLRRRVTKNGAKYPSISSVNASQISLSTATSSLESKPSVASLSDVLNGDHRRCSFAMETSSQGGSLVSYNPTFSSLPSPTILESSTEETISDATITE